ncbi:hypothetical protein FOA43_003777 [Brettanomyces nanus]|uniref:Coronin n=1 Tax=Eeniella nana TaxID=13502 RepID=A0A875S613_EENNA|nr:uncharacterized protein FOA43_003777 [Brettanomyces nanus]QPG76388.1 hypothetical protein FOA43_003777 [Brettanomyces nanus]
MRGQFVRASKYRHVFGQAFKKELCYENLKATLNAFDSNLLQCNGKYIIINANGIGSIVVVPVGETGKAPEKVPMFRGHAGGSVMDTAFDPFDDQKFASTGEDGKILLWEIPKDYSFIHNDPKNIVDVKPVGELTGHTRKVGHVAYNPVAKDVLASSAFDYSVKIWNAATKLCEVNLQHRDFVTSFCFNYDGTKIATTCRDKKIRVWDVRSGKLLCEGSGHPGAKASRIVWLGNTERLLTTGFDRYSERQLGVWKADAIDEGPIGGFYSVDSSSGIMMPFYDPSTNMLFIGGKGDGNIRYYEFADDELYEISEFQSTDAQRGLAVTPKRSVNVKENEIVRAYKLLNDNSVEPISFIVPRRSEMFQEDIYSDAPAVIPAMTAEEYFSGKTVPGPILMSMKDLYDGKVNPETKNSVARPEEKPKEKAKEEVKEEIKEVKEEPSRPIFVKSQEQGVDNMLKEKAVNGLLDKVNNLSDDDTQDVDFGDNKAWEPESEPKMPRNPSERAKSEEPEKTEEPEKAEKAEKAVKSVKAEKAEKPEKPEETKNSKSEDSKPEKTAEKAVNEPKVIKPTPATTSIPRTVGLKANVEKLQVLITKLESTIDKLIESNLDKDARLKSLECKVETLLKQ